MLEVGILLISAMDNDIAWSINDSGLTKLLDSLTTTNAHCMNPFRQLNTRGVLDQRELSPKNPQENIQNTAV